VELWTKVSEHRERTSAAGALRRPTREQQVKWMWSMLEER
jgi:LAO/AO transport system kinase